MQIVVNGERANVDSSKLKAILEQLGYLLDDVVVAHNFEFIPRARWEDCNVEENDTLDVLTSMVGG